MFLFNVTKIKILIKIVKLNSNGDWLISEQLKNKEKKVHKKNDFNLNI